MIIGGTAKDDSGDEWLNLDQKVILLYLACPICCCGFSARWPAIALHGRTVYEIPCIPNFVQKLSHHSCCMPILDL
jgi:hypothetical protein